MSQENLESEVARLRAENEALKARTQHRGGQLRVSDKGGVSVYGLGRFPVTLYKEQWRRLLDMADEIRAFIREHESELKSKDGRSRRRAGLDWARFQKRMLNPSTGPCRVTSHRKRLITDTVE